MKKQKREWFPNNRAAQMVMFTNIKAKIGGYAAILPLTAAQVGRIEAICDVFTAVYNFTEQTRATGTSITEWQDNVFTGSPAGDIAPDPPPFPSFAKPTGFTIGIFEEFRDLRDKIIEADGYTDAIGEDLMLVAPEADDVIEDALIPEIGVQTSIGYKVQVTGSLQGTDAMKFYYRRKGGEFVAVGFLTKLPGEFPIPPQTAGTAESGEIYAVFVKDNEEIGQRSLLHSITLS